MVAEDGRGRAQGRGGIALADCVRLVAGASKDAEAVLLVAIVRARAFVGWRSDGSVCGCKST